jgi:hypothetical protein
MQVEFSAIHPDHILPLWKKIAPLFERLVNEQGSDSLENIFNSLVIKQHNLLWMAWEKDNLDNILMVISTRLVEGGIFEILGCVGQDRYLWMNYFSTLEQYAKDNNCTRIMIKNGRKGWQRDLSKQGMKITGYTFEKNI